MFFWGGVVGLRGLLSVGGGGLLCGNVVGLRVCGVGLSCFGGLLSLLGVSWVEFLGVDRFDDCLRVVCRVLDGGGGVVPGVVSVEFGECVFGGMGSVVCRGLGCPRGGVGVAVTISNPDVCGESVRVVFDDLELSVCGVRVFPSRCVERGVLGEGLRVFVPEVVGVPGGSVELGVSVSGGSGEGVVEWFVDEE